MTLYEAKKLLIEGKLGELKRQMPIGNSLKQIFLDCLTYTSGAELDSMVEKCVGLQRHQGVYMWGASAPPESDVDLRTRAERFAYTLDNYVEPTPVKKHCYHSWKFYQGIMEQYDYCEFCDEKRKK